MPSTQLGDPHAARAAPTRRRLLALLQDEAPQDAHQLAEATTLHVTTVRFHLQILERAGLVASRPDPRGRSGRPRTVYSATEHADPGTVGRLHRDLTAYQHLTSVLAAHLDDTAESRSERAEQAGASWAAQLTSPTARAADPAAATGRVQQLCAELGFDPSLDADGDGWRIFLRACPYRSVARAHPEVVCAVHRGLIRGALEEAGFPHLRTNLTPFVEPELCIADVGAGEDAAPHAREPV